MFSKFWLLRDEDLSASVKKGKFVTKTSFLDNVEWSSKNWENEGRGRGRGLLKVWQKLFVDSFSEPFQSSAGFSKSLYMGTYVCVNFLHVQKKFIGLTNTLLNTWDSNTVCIILFIWVLFGTADLAYIIVHFLKSFRRTLPCSQQTISAG